MTAKTIAGRAAAKRYRNSAKGRANYRRHYETVLKPQRQARRYQTPGSLTVLQAKARPCADCEKLYPPWVMDFDHVIGEKLFCLGSAAQSKGIAALKAEMLKCEVVCSNCHRQRTHNRKYGVE